MTDRTTYNIAVLPGDGIGPEVIRESIKVLRAVAGMVTIMVMTTPRAKTGLSKP